MPTSDILERARRAISSNESGGRYGITGPATNGDVPLGRYQVMTSNLPSWSMAALGRQVSPREFLSNDKLQDAVFDHRFGGYLDKYGPAGAARAWFGGEGKVRGGGKATDILGTSVDGYEAKFLKAFGSASDDEGWEPVSGAPAASDDGWEPVPDASAAPEPKPEGNTHYEGRSTFGPSPYMTPEGPDLGKFQADSKRELGTAVQDAKEIAQGTWDLVKRVGHDIVNPSDAVEDVKKIGSAVASIPGKIGEAAQDPNAALDKFVKYGRDHPVSLGSVFIPPGVARTIASLPGRAVSGVDALGAATVGRALTGVSGDLQREATRAGMAGGAQAREFKGQLRGTTSPDRPVQLAEEAEDAIHQRGLSDRNATIAAGAGAQAAPNTGARLNAALQSARQGNRDVAGIVQSAEIEDMLDALGRHVDTAFPNGTPRNAAVLSVDGMDALKRRLGQELSARGAFSGGGQAGRLGGGVYNEVKQAITDAFPDYAPGMARAEQSITALQQVQRQLSLNSRNRATTGGALQSAARNDAHGGYGMRREALDTLRRERPELVSALSGQALGTMSPRGIAPWMMMGAGHHMFGGLPAALLQYVASIPRLHGEVRYGIGSAIRKARQAGITSRNAGGLIDALRLGAVAQNAQESE